MTRTPTWRSVASRQGDLITRDQLRELGLGRNYVRDHVRAGRWRIVSSTVIATTTGLLHRDQLMWAGVLNAGPVAALGGLTALEVHGLRNWHRDPVQVLVPKSLGLEPIPGVVYVETRRPISWYGVQRRGLPVWPVEPAALLFAGYHRVTRTGYGLLSAVVQQRLTTPADLEGWLPRMNPLRRSKAFRRLFQELAGGVQSVAELDVSRMCRRHQIAQPLRQTRRRDANGRIRYTDAEWLLPDGRVVVLEVEGAFHREVDHWVADIERERSLVVTGKIVLRCTAIELREDDSFVAADLRRLGVGRPRSCGPGRTVRRRSRPGSRGS